jgi:hypothetical protein
MQDKTPILIVFEPRIRLRRSSELANGCALRAGDVACYVSTPGFFTFPRLPLGYSNCGAELISELLSGFSTMTRN